MRNPKFRLYDNLNKKWLLGYEFPNLGGFSMIGETMMFGEYSKVISSFRLEDLQHLILEQYTEIKDKNLKEIYEGDIVRILGGEEHQGMREYDITGIVKFSHGSFCVVKDEVHYDFGSFDSLEVIGNIHE